MQYNLAYYFRFVCLIIFLILLVHISLPPSDSDVYSARLYDALDSGKLCWGGLKVGLMLQPAQPGLQLRLRH